MQTRNVAVCDKLGRRLKTYPIAIPSREDGPQRDVGLREGSIGARESRQIST